MSEENATTEQPTPKAADAAQTHLIMDTDTRSALSEVIAIVGAQRQTADDGDEVQKQVDEAPIVRLANTILQSAIKEKASDIHIEPDRRNIRVRFRIDGVLHEVIQMPGYIKAPLVARYKILSEMNILECRMPQQGRISALYAGEEYNFRCSTLPSQYGEKIVIHLSVLSGVKLSLNQIGLTPEVQTKIEDLLFWRQGMLLIASGNGQGKTTTQYTLLNPMNTVGKSIFAVAPDYDYILPGITQARLNPRIGYTAEAALRSIAELDADVVALDKCRSREALRTALEMATGNTLVLHTLHASSSTAALHQLLSEAEADPGLVAEGLCGILVQTLVKRVCQQCKEIYEVPAGDLRRFGYEASNPTERVELARGKGCEMCRNTGYKGRIALFELVTMNDSIAEAIFRRASRIQLQQVIYGAQPPVPMREDGLIKILQGITTPEEVLRAVPLLKN